MKQFFTDMHPLLTCGLFLLTCWLLVRYWDRKRARDLEAKERNRWPKTGPVMRIKK